MKIEAGKRYTMTRNVRGEDRETFTATVNWVEDRGDFLYIGYEPDDHRNGMWGCCKVKKQGQYRAVNYRFEEAA